jgi:hypothetical protein
MMIFKKQSIKIRMSAGCFALAMIVILLSHSEPFQISDPKPGGNSKKIITTDDQKKWRLQFRNDSIFRRPNFEGDNWHTTYASDGNQYVLQCDGQGYNTKMWRLVGTPQNFKFEAVSSHPGPKEKPRERYYGFGILGVGPFIYHFMSTPNRWYVDPPWKFIGAKLIYSADTGHTWRNQDGSSPVIFEETSQRNKNNMVFFNEQDEAFALMTMLQMGKGYEQNKDGYIYVYSPNGGREGKMNQLVMFRVPKDKMLQRNAYEYFVSLKENGEAQWSKNIADRNPVQVFPTGYVNKLKHPYSWHPSVIYNKGLNVYMMANWGVGTDSTGNWFTRPSYLGVWISEKPWGPWKQIHEDKAWLPPGGTKEGQCYQPQIMPGWIAADGKSFWLAWTQYPKGYYFQLQRVDIVKE